MHTNLPNKPFSKRHGYHPRPKEITVWEEAPENLRRFVLDKAEELGCNRPVIRDCICSVLHVRWGEAQRLVYECEWFFFYDFVETIYRDLIKNWRSLDTPENPNARAGMFQDALNEFFIDEGIGWQMIDGEIVARGSETFESNIRGAVEALESAGRTTAKDEIHEALADLSRRPGADLTGAVQHAMAALECVARDVCGDNQATLGQIIKRYPGVIPKPLDDSVEKAWGYASEMARHIHEGRKPERKEVELIVGLAATVATYLSR